MIEDAFSVKMAMNFEGFQDLIRRIARTWYERAKAEVKNIFKINSMTSYLDH